MTTIYILHDPRCGFCESCRSWMSRQAAFLELRFVPMRSAQAARQFPGLEKFIADGDLVVVSDEGAVYRGPSAYLMCLYALKEYREWALRLAAPALLPLARRVFLQLSKQRDRISRWFFDKTPQQIEERLGAEATPSCVARADGRNRKPNCLE
jgi:predicted DCC family thiol-disulfide oxidoreductase YuxK